MVYTSPTLQRLPALSMKFKTGLRVAVFIRLRSLRNWTQVGSPIHFDMRSMLMISSTSSLAFRETSFSDLAYSNDLLWAPDGDETFDDGSYILQFDLGDRVRLIAFKRSENGLHDPFTLRDVWISAEGYSRVLERTNPACWGVLKKRTHRGPLGRERAIQRLGKEYVSPDSIAACSIALIGPAESEIIDNGPDIDLKKVGLINPSLRGGLANGRWHHPGAESQVRAISMNADSERGHS